MKIINKNKMAQTTKITLLSFFVLVLVGGFLLNLPISNARPHDFLNSIFTSTASICVAGLSTVTVAEQYTLIGKFIMLLLIQIGALGFILVLAAFSIITKKKMSYKDTLNIGSVLGTSDNLKNIKILIRRVIKYTLISEFIGAVFLAFRFIPMFGIQNGICQSIFTSVSAFCNCGFDLLRF